MQIKKQLSLYWKKTLKKKKLSYHNNPKSPNKRQIKNSQEIDIESIKDLLPQGFIDIKKENNSLNLEFNNKLCYQLALRGLQKTKADIKERTGLQINIVPFFSESNAAKEEDKPQTTHNPEPCLAQQINEPQEPQNPQSINDFIQQDSIQPVKTLNALEEERKT